MIGRLITVGAVGLAGVAAVACAAEAPELSACSVNVTTVAEGDAFPCRPFPPQRMDVLMVGTDSAAVTRCGLLGGSPTNDAIALAAGKTRCRTVVVP